MPSIFTRLTLLCLLVFPLVAQARSPRPSMDEAMAALPDRLGALVRRGDVVDYEARGAAGLGRSVNYGDRASRTWATVYIYSAGQTGIPDGIENPAVQSQFSNMRREILEVYAAGRNNSAGVTEIRQHDISRTARLAFHCIDVRIERDGAQNSLACVGGLNGRFIKLRITMPADGTDIATAYALAEQLLASQEGSARP